jgi:catechol 2,3-dioxygenase-like lactoylglutathione lyase family enzyme
MINGINLITFAVSNLDRALKLYVELLELKLIARWDGGAYLKAGHHGIALNVGALLKTSVKESA